MKNMLYYLCFIPLLQARTKMTNLWEDKEEIE